MNAESTLATLIQRGYVEEIGHDPGPGQAILYGTTRRFLEQMGLDSLQDLPPLADFVPEAEVVEALERGLRIDRAPDSTDLPEHIERAQHTEVDLTEPDAPEPDATEPGTEGEQSATE